MPVVVEKQFTGTRAHSPKTGNWDHYAAWGLGESGWLGLVADAPSTANIESGNLAAGVTADYLDDLGRESIARSLETDYGKFVLADIATLASDRLRNRRNDWHTAVAWLAVSGKKIHALVVGDCAIYLQFSDAERCLRISDTTRVASRSFLADDENAAPSHYREGIYLGTGDATPFSPRDIFTAPSAEISRALLTSDGLESQLGLPRIRKLIASASEFHEQEFDAQLEKSHSLKDDISFIGIALTPAPAISKIEPPETHDPPPQPLAEKTNAPPPISIFRRLVGWLLILAFVIGLGFAVWMLAQEFMNDVDAEKSSENPTLENLPPDSENVE